jgi:hypothetical protein
MIHPVGRLRGTVVVLSVLAALAVLPANVGAVGGPSIPGLPGVPHIHLPKPDQKAVFDVIVEGKQKDHNTSQLSDPKAACAVQEDGTVDETDTYLRGRDVKIEFDRYGHTIIMKRDRGGQLGDTSLAVTVTVERTAEGTITFTPNFPMVTCPQTTDIGKNADCGVPKKVGGSPAMVLGWNNGEISLDPSNRTAKMDPPNKCGEVPETGVSNQVFYAWPHPAKLFAIESFPARKVFNRHLKVIVIKMQSARGMGPKGIPPHTVAWNSFGLTGTVTDVPDNTATVRFIRQPG